jgi:hypothetical protein
MTFSYLRAIAQRKKSNYTTQIVISILDIFLLISLVAPNPVLLNLQLVYLIVQMIFSVFTLIAGLFADEMFKKHIAKKNYMQIIDFVQIYNFREKFGWFSNIYSILSNGLAIYAMITLGWIWQPVLFLLMLTLGLSSLYSFIEDLPNQVDNSSLKEEDFYGYY